MFEENDGSQVAQFHVSDVDDVIPQEAIRRMGVGFFRPVEEPLVAEREGQCSTQMEPSSSSELQASAAGANNAPDQRQAQDPLLSDLPLVARSETSATLTGESDGQRFRPPRLEIPVYLKLNEVLLKIPPPLIVMICLQGIKVSFPVKTGTQMIKMIK